MNKIKTRGYSYLLQVFFIIPILWGISATSCSIRKMALNSVSDMLAPGIEAEAKESGGAMFAFTSENDPELVADAFPVILKVYEGMMFENPEHSELAVMTGQLYIMYGNAFLQGQAEMYPPNMIKEQNYQYTRASNFFKRGRSYSLNALEMNHPGFYEAVFQTAGDARSAMMDKMKKEDTGALFWAASGALADFSLNPLDAEAIDSVEGSVAMMEKAAELYPEYFNGIIWETLFTFYSAAPDFMGGGMEKAETAYEKALEIGGGSASLYTAYAKNICIPAQDIEGFLEALDKALAINPDKNISSRLMTVLAQQKARWLLDNKGTFFLE